jgi:hypothetical protein
MYMSYQVLRHTATGGLPTAEQRAADEQLGRLAAAASQLGRDVAAGARGLAGVLSLAGGHSVIFRKTDPRTCPAQAPAQPSCLRPR